MVTPEQVVADGAPQGKRYSICTLVTNPEQYREMLGSFQAGGFTDDCCEYLYIDNSRGNTVDGYKGVNLFLARARGRFVIICHQDIELVDDGRAELDRAIDELDQFDPEWAVCGNAGATDTGSLGVRITDPSHFSNARLGAPFPARTMSLDENLLIVRADANLSVSHNLSGFHLYGADLCIMADILGLATYVIDFHVLHKSDGRVDESFERARREIIEKYRIAFRPRWVHVTTGRSFHISGSKRQNFFARAKRVNRRSLRPKVTWWGNSVWQALKARLGPHRSP